MGAFSVHRAWCLARCRPPNFRDSPDCAEGKLPGYRRTGSKTVLHPTTTLPVLPFQTNPDEAPGGRRRLTVHAAVPEHIGSRPRSAGTGHSRGPDRPGRSLLREGNEPCAKS
jgi:hypothetical protein